MFTPSRREARLLRELADLTSIIMKLIHAYSERTGIRVLGILVCEVVTDEILKAL